MAADDPNLRTGPIIFIAGTRPEAVKPAPLILYLRGRGELPVLGGLLQALAELASLAEIIVPVYPSPAASVPAPAALGGVAGVNLLPPLPYAGFVALMRQVALVLTYSGGVRKEAPTIGLLCLVLR